MGEELGRVCKRVGWSGETVGQGGGKFEWDRGCFGWDPLSLSLTICPSDKLCCCLITQQSPLTTLYPLPNSIPPVFSLSSFLPISPPFHLAPTPLPPTSHAFHPGTPYACVAAQPGDVFLLCAPSLGSSGYVIPPVVGFYSPLRFLLPHCAAARAHHCTLETGRSPPQPRAFHFQVNSSSGKFLVNGGMSQDNLT